METIIFLGRPADLARLAYRLARARAEAGGEFGLRFIGPPQAIPQDEEAVAFWLELGTGALDRCSALIEAEYLGRERTLVTVSSRAGVNWENTRAVWEDLATEARRLKLVEPAEEAKEEVKIVSASEAEIQKRRARVAKYFRQGMTNAKIAERESVSESTIKNDLKIMGLRRRKDSRKDRN